MHRLHLLRHAKASRDDDYEDHERPLSRRGREEARRVGEGLPAAVDALDLVLCSTSLRTRQTAELALAGFRAAAPQILYEERLYLAPAATLLRRLRGLDEAVGAVMVIGHNPGLQELTEALAEPTSAHHSALASGRFPTGVRASFVIDGGWASLDRGQHRLIDFVTPKSLDD